MLQSIERLMKQAIVDKVHAVSSAALVSSLVSQCTLLSVDVYLHFSNLPFKCVMISVYLEVFSP